MVQIPVDRAEIERFCQRWKIREFSFFGSVLRDDFRPDSDVDVLVDFAPEAQWSLFDLGEMTEDLRDLFGRDVDLLTRKRVERSENYIRRREVLRSLESVYVAR
jgi:predicted nucleotidyltransferase